MKGLIRPGLLQIHIHLKTALQNRNSEKYALQHKACLQVAGKVFTDKAGQLKRICPAVYLYAAIRQTVIFPCAQSRQPLFWSD